MADESKYKYTAITFAPIQGFIEKSRKLRDLYGASRILSHLTYKLIEQIKEYDSTIIIISPGIPTLQEGMPNRLLIEGSLDESDIREFIVGAWRNVLNVCKAWIENKFRAYKPNYQFYWESQWKYWRQNTWEIFVGKGNTPEETMENLENNKLGRDWTALNWVGESSSLTGTDAIIHPDINNRRHHNPRYKITEDRQKKVKEFYNYLSCFLEGKDPNTEIPEGKFLDPEERLSVPELVKRMVTREDIGKQLDDMHLDKSFSDIVRTIKKDKEKTEGQWTGWFMGDGDEVGKKLKELAQQGTNELQNFTEDMRNWGDAFKENFPKELGRVIYAGGDDFLGVIYSQDVNQPIPALTALEWLIKFPQTWNSEQKGISVSVGFVWVASRVPQRDVLQHCREAETKAKLLGRDRCTIRIVFNSGQYIDWTCPWQHLYILTKYQDREGIGYKDKDFHKYQTRKGADCDLPPNWNHIYQDLAHLKARHAINLSGGPNQISSGNEDIALRLFDLYFPGYGDCIDKNAPEMFKNNADLESAILSWIDGLIHVGWYLCRQPIASRPQPQLQL